MLGMLSTTGVVSCLAALAACLPQGPNTVAQNNPSARTMSVNGTYFIVPISKSKVASVTKPYKLLNIDYNNKNLFPNGFPADKFPVLVSTSFDHDIRQFQLEIDNLLGASVYVPYVDRLSDGKTPFLFPVRNYIGGYNGNDVAAVVPALGSTGFVATPAFVASIMPNTAAYESIGNGQYISQVKDVIIPNPISGPGVEPSAFDLQFHTATNPIYPAKTFHTMLNQPLILLDGLCNLNTIYFNQSFTEPIMRTGMVTLYSDAVFTATTIPSALAGTFTGNGGYSASGEQIGSISQQECAAAAMSIDPKASQ